MTGNTGLLEQLSQAICACKPSEPPSAAQFSPELMADCEILITAEDGLTHSFYYVEQSKHLIYTQITKGKDRDSLRYLYYSDGGALGDLIKAQRQNASLKQDNTVKPFRSMEELIASIDADELAEQGTELGFEFYTDAVPPDSGTACNAYTFKTYPPLPNDRILITVYGKSKTGEQQKLSVIGMEANSTYTKIIVQEPDEALDSVDTDGDNSPESYAILFQKSAIDLKKWLVFVDGDGNILDVIIPEDIEGIEEVIDTPVTPIDNPEEGSDAGSGDSEDSEPSGD